MSLSAGRFGHLLSVAEQRLEKFAEGTVLEGANRPRLFRRKVFERRTIGDRLGVASDEIGDGVTFVRVNAEKAFASGIGDLTHVFRELDFGNEGVSLFDGRQFVDGTKFGVAVSRDEAFAHPVAVDAASLGDDRRDGAFVQTVGSHDLQSCSPASSSRARTFLER